MFLFIIMIAGISVNAMPVFQSGQFDDPKIILANGEIDPGMAMARFTPQRSVPYCIFINEIAVFKSEQFDASRTISAEEEREAKRKAECDAEHMKKLCPSLYPKTLPPYTENIFDTTKPAVRFIARPNHPYLVYSDDDIKVYCTSFAANGRVVREEYTYSVADAKFIADSSFFSETGSFVSCIFK
jgi:hypothetical protein